MGKPPSSPSSSSTWTRAARTAQEPTLGVVADRITKREEWAYVNSTSTRAARTVREPTLGAVADQITKREEWAYVKVWPYVP